MICSPSSSPVIIASAPASLTSAKGYAVLTSVRLGVDPAEFLPYNPGDLIDGPLLSPVGGWFPHSGSPRSLAGVACHGLILACGHGSLGQRGE